jgi:hypothetical protein
MTNLVVCLCVCARIVTKQPSCLAVTEYFAAAAHMRSHARPGRRKIATTRKTPVAHKADGRGGASLANANARAPFIC